MTIGIVVPTLNRVRKTRRFIDCLMRQTYQDFHLYMIDSGSSDGTRLLPDEGKVPITLIEATLDDWWSSGTNTGIKKAMSDGCNLFLTINDDSILLPDYLASFVDLMDKHDLSICANRIDYADQPGRVWALGSYSIWSSPYLFQLRYHGWWEDQLPDEVKDAELIQSMAVCGDGVMIRKRVFDRIGYYNERFTPQVHGDSEFVMRAAQNGIDVYVSPKIVLYNDIYNLSEDKPAKEPVKPSIRRVTKELFFWKKSDLYWRPIFYIAWKFAPRGKFLPTIAKFYVHKISVYYRQFLPKMMPYNATGRLQKKSPLRKWFILKVLKLLSWSLNKNRYDDSTLQFAEEDATMQKLIQTQHTQIENIRLRFEIGTGDSTKKGDR